MHRVVLWLPRLRPNYLPLLHRRFPFPRRPPEPPPPRHRPPWLSRSPHRRPLHHGALHGQLHQRAVDAQREHALLSLSAQKDRRHALHHQRAHFHHPLFPLQERLANVDGRASPDPSLLQRQFRPER